MIWISKISGRKMRMLHYFVVSILLHFSLIQTVKCQIVINEFMAANSSVNQDPDFGEYADWVEIYNAGTVAVNLQGYFLTDNLGIPAKWQITQSTILQAGDFLLIWADGMNTGMHTSFKLSATSEEIGLFSQALILQDSITYNVQKTDISAGRSINGSGVWGNYLIPSPGASNSTSQFFEDFAKNAPEFSIKGGIYQSAQNLQLTAPLGGIISFTLDGSEPQVSSTLYTTPLEISANTIVRARIFKDGMIPGPVITHSYFLDGDLKSRQLPVVSISTHPENFWDPVKGIYVQDFKPDWEIPANIELFENNGSDRAAFNEQVGIKINGLYSWKLPQKMLGIYFKGQYGTSNLGYHLLFHKERSSYKDFALRASGSDWSYTMFRDLLGQDASRLNSKLDFMDFRPSVVFFNGEYMGIHNIREKVDADYIEKNHNIEPGTFDMVENEEFAEAGDLTNYNYLKTLLAKDLSIESNFQAVAELIDIENFTDLVITEMAVANTSIDHNVMAWKPKEYGKWNWVIMDLDRGFFNPSNNLINFYLNQNSFPFRELMTNLNYQKYFGQRLADHLFTSYHPDRMKILIDSHADNIENEIPNHVERWLGTTSSYGNAMPSVDYWYKEVCNLRTFVEARPQALLADLDNYGFNGIANLYIAVTPATAGSITINNLQIPESVWSGLYLKNVNSKITAVDKPGFSFLGWKNAVKKVIIPKGSVWKYLDDGSDQWTAWKDPGFSDASWKSGPAQLGYEEGDEATVLGYGGNINNRFITYYFRHSFNLTAADLASSGFILSLLRDDGAVVYINGIEVIRSNMTCGTITNQTLATSSIAGQAESLFTQYTIDGSLLIEGVNNISVEVHQNAKNSTDLSFDLELTGLSSNNSTYISTNRELPITLTDDTYLSAEYEPTGQCIVSEVISGEVILDAACSPYIVQGDIKINYGSGLIIQPGVEIWMSPKANIMVEGKIEAIGNASERILIKINPAFDEESWGAITFLNTSDTSKFSYVTIENASEGEIPIRDYAALSAFNGDLVLDHLIIENVNSNPIVTRYSDIVLTNSSLHSEVSGDLINAKYGTARIENSVFRGSNSIDGDAIDFDGIEDGIIRSSKIYNCLGFNSDALDIGENCTNLLIDSVSVANIFDKGVSVGQNSSVTIINSTFVNCSVGMGLKDLSHVIVNHCSFYGNTIPINCYEKNPGSAGGIATVKNSILSNSSIASYSFDSQSSLEIHHSLSDNTPLPAAPGNKFRNPLFSNPVNMDFSLLPSSPAIMTGEDGGAPVNMGSGIMNIKLKPFPMISHVYINSFNAVNPEFIGIFNPSTEITDLSNYSVSEGFTFIFPDGTYLNPYETLYLTSDADSPEWYNFPKQVFQWTDGRLSNNGEAINLLENHGIVVDYINYTDLGGWPTEAFTEGLMMSLKNTETDNHFGENWLAESADKVFSIIKSIETDGLLVYPNPTYDKVNITAPANEKSDILIYSAQGKLLGRQSMENIGYIEVNLAKYDQGVVILKIGNKAKKVIVLK